MFVKCYIKSRNPTIENGQRHTMCVQRIKTAHQNTMKIILIYEENIFLHLDLEYNIITLAYF